MQDIYQPRVLNSLMKMLIDEIHYDNIEEDYGFFCDMDNEILPGTINKVIIKSIIKENIRKLHNENQYISFRCRLAIVNSLLLVGTCVSSIILCYSYMKHTKSL